MTTNSKSSADGAGVRKQLSAATLAALWTVSNGQCYAPGCAMPVVLEVRPGVYKKNSQVAHVYGVKPGAARYRPDMPTEQRDSFANLLLLCLAHHGEVDEDERRYPPEELLKWKTLHEGAQNSVLNRLTVLDTDALMGLLAKIAEPPLGRLEAITERLERTGEVTGETVAELKQIIAMMSGVGAVDTRAARHLAYAAEVLGTSSFSRTASTLANVAEVLPGVVEDLNRAARRMGEFR